LAPFDLSEDLYAHVGEWRSHPVFTEAERIAIEFAEKFALDHASLDDAFFARMRAYFSDEEILEISICVGTWLSLGRITKIMDAGVSCPVRLELREPTGGERRA